MENKFWKVTNSVDSSESTLILEGPIASETWWGDEVTPEAFRNELKQITSKNLTVSINSVGGDVWAGVSIYNTLKELDAEVTVRVDGLAASIASVIAMAGDKIIMSPGSMMMIHRASSVAFGNKDDMQQAIKMLEVVDESITGIYTSRTGLSTEEVSTMMEAETWMTAEKAVELGFADVAAKAKEAEEQIVPQNIFSSKMLALSMSATKESLDSFATKVAATDEVETPVEEPTPDPIEEPTKEELVEEVEETEVEEPKVEEVITNNEEETQMTEAETIAQTQVIAPTAQADVTPKPDMKSYLKTKDSMEAFARILEEQAGKTSDDVRAAWKGHLEVTMGVTNPDVFLPEAFITEIQDAFKEGGEIWNRVTKTGVDVFKAAWDIEDDVDSEDGRARGYNRAEEEEKAEQVLEFSSREIRPKFVYKYIQLNKEDVKNQRSAGALVRYVLSELPRRIIREIERAIVIGDGRAPGSDYKISSFTAIKADTTAANVFASTYTPVVGESHYESILRARSLIKAEGAVVLIAKDGYMTDMLLERNTADGLVFAPGTDLQRVLRLDAVIEPDWMDKDTDNDAYLVTLSNYKTVGDNSIEAFTNFRLEVNKQQYLQEIWAGGALTVRKSAVAIAAAATS